MNQQQVFARSAVEALRSGVPSKHAVEQLGTTQSHVTEAYEARLDAMAAGQGVEPLVISASFGAGKSHLLNYLKTMATRRHCVTSFVVVSPELPLGNPHVVLEAIAEAAEAPDRTGSALRSLAADLHTSSDKFVALRMWAREAGIDERFVAMLQLYEELRADEEFRTQILEDFEGGALAITLLRQKLKEIGQAAGYAIKAKKTGLLAHDRIRLLAQFYRACGITGWVVLFDELERFVLFPAKQRLAAWQELGWWEEAARENGACILPVFAVAAGLAQHAVDVDEPMFRSSASGPTDSDPDQRGTRGIQMVKTPLRLNSTDSIQEAAIRYRVKSIYEDAYGMRVPEQDSARNDVRTSIRSEIRRWITLWDLQRCYPDYVPSVSKDEVRFDPKKTDNSVMATDEEGMSGSGWRDADTAP